jgi:hypothetical protein
VAKADFSTPRISEENEAQAGGKNSRNPRKRGENANGDTREMGLFSPKSSFATTTDFPQIIHAACRVGRALAATHQSSSGRNAALFSNAARDGSYLTRSFGEYELIANLKKVKKTQNDAQKIGSSFRLETGGQTANGCLACAGREFQLFRASQIQVGKNSTQKASYSSRKTAFPFSRNGRGPEIPRKTT